MQLATIPFMPFRKADALLKEKFQRSKNHVDKDAVKQRMDEYQAECFAYLDKATDPEVRHRTEMFTLTTRQRFAGSVQHHALL